MATAGTMAPTLRIVRKSQPPRNEHRQGARRPRVEQRSHTEEWLTTLSHELRSPLATILDALDLAFCDVDNPRAQRAGEIARRQAHKAIKLIDDLFDLSAQSCGTLVLRKQSMNVADVVERATETASHLFIGRKHVLSVSLPSKPVFISADPLRLEQVLTNLLINAAKFTDSGGHIRLSVTEEFSEIVIGV